MKLIPFIIQHAHIIYPGFRLSAEELYEKASDWNDGVYFVNFMGDKSTYHYHHLAVAKLKFPELYDQLVVLCGKQSTDFTILVDEYLRDHPQADKPNYDFGKTEDYLPPKEEKLEVGYNSEDEEDISWPQDFEHETLDSHPSYVSDFELSDYSSDEY